MKKIVYYILFSVLILLPSNIFAYIEYNTDSNIKKAVLIEDYIYKHKEKIDDFIKNYWITNNSSIKKNLNWLNESIEALQKIQTTQITKQQADNVLNAVLDRIKIINDDLKQQLEIEKSLFEKRLNEKKSSYTQLWLVLWKKIDAINYKIAQNIFKNKTHLTVKENRIKEILISLNKESLKLKNFWKINFNSEKEVKDTFIIILQNIKRQINQIKQNLN